MEIDVRYQKFDDLLGDFYEHLKNTLVEIQKADDQDLEKFSQNQNQLKSDLELTTAKNNETVEEFSAISLDIEQLQKKLSVMMEEKYSCDNSIAKLKEKSNQLKVESAAKEEEIQELLKENENRKTCQIEQLKETDDIVAAYGLYMGLEVRILKDKRLQILFKNIKEGEIAYIILKMKDHNYEILETFPVLEEIKKLENKLNATNNLAGFVQACRQRLIEQS